MALRRTSETRVVLWVEWGGYYVDEQSASPQICLRHHRVFDLNSAAWLKGATHGMQRHQVRVLCPDCEYRTYASDEARASRWLDVCARFSHRVERIDEHLAAVDLSDHPDPYDIAGQLKSELEAMGLGRLRIGAGPSKWLSRLSSELGRDLVPLSDPREYLSGLAINHLLPATDEVRRRLQFLGYRRIGEVAELPVAVLMAQFGQEAHRIHLAANGVLLEPVDANYPSDSIAASLSFPDGIYDSQQVDAACKEVCRRLSTQLEGKQASELSLEWTAEVGAGTCNRRFKRAVQDQATLLAAVKSLLATENLAGLSRLTVRMHKVEPVQSQQVGLFTRVAIQAPQASMTHIVHALGDGVLMKASGIQLSRREKVLSEWRRATGWN